MAEAALIVSAVIAAVSSSYTAYTSNETSKRAREAASTQAMMERENANKMIAERRRAWNYTDIQHTRKTAGLLSTAQSQFAGMGFSVDEDSSPFEMMNQMAADREMERREMERGMEYEVASIRDQGFQRAWAAETEAVGHGRAATNALVGGFLGVSGSVIKGYGGYKKYQKTGEYTF